MVQGASKSKAKSCGVSMHGYLVLLGGPKINRIGINTILAKRSISTY